MVAGSGCWTVTPPKQVKDPVPIYLADYGVHSSVMLPFSPGMYAEYSFGDYAYTVEDRDMPWNAVAALLISFQSTLGRTLTPVSPTDSVPPTHRRPRRIYVLYVERSKANAVVDKLEARYESDHPPREYSTDTQAFYVKDDHHYSLFSTCNHMSANILQDSGCTVHGLPFMSDFVVIEP